MKIKYIPFKNFERMDRAHYNDSGADIFALDDIILEPQSITKISTGFGLEIPDGYDAVIHCKSGLSAAGLLIANAPIDAGYRGEIHIIMYNTNNDIYYIKKGQKIGQLVIRPVIYADFVRDLGSERKDGGFGSTGL